MVDSKKVESVGEEKAKGGGESQGGAYPNPHNGDESDGGGPDDFLGHGGQSKMGYHGTGQLGGENAEGADNPNAPPTSD